MSRSRFRHPLPVPTLLFLAAVLLAPAASGAETAPSLREAERNLRAAELRQNDETAMALYRRAGSQAEAILATNPDSAGANFVYFAATSRILMAEGLARNLMTLRQLDRTYLDRALELDPDHADALATKGGILLDLPVLIGGDPSRGLGLLRRAARLNPGGAGTQVALAKALARNGDQEGARKQAAFAAHRARVQGRRKALDEAMALLGNLAPGVVRAGFH